MQIFYTAFLRVWNDRIPVITLLEGWGKVHDLRGGMSLIGEGAMSESADEAVRSVFAKYRSSIPRHCISHTPPLSMPYAGTGSIAAYLYWWKEAPTARSPAVPIIAVHANAADSMLNRTFPAQFTLVKTARGDDGDLLANALVASCAKELDDGVKGWRKIGKPFRIPFLLRWIQWLPMSS